MKPMVFGLVQADFTVGALQENARKVVRLAREAAARGADAAVFPELCLCGYPPEDLVLKPHFIEEAEFRLRELAATLPPDLLVLVGAPLRRRGRVYNTACALAAGEIVAEYRKSLLPNYGVFDEHRVFHPGRGATVLCVNGFRIGLHICEDSWFPDAAPTRLLAAAHVDAVVNLSASPYHLRKSAFRRELLTETSRRIGAPLLYCNLVGGQDELVFDGSSLVVTGDGALQARASAFAEEILWFSQPAPRAGRPAPPPSRARVDVDIPLKRSTGGPPPPPARTAPELDPCAEIYEALKLGLRDYMDKNGFPKAVVALSGGLDSALVAAIAVDALGRDRVSGITMPSRYSSDETRTDAERLAQNLRIPLLTVPIEPVYASALEALKPQGVGETPGIPSENLQARIRGLLVMAFSNQFGWLVLSTGNKSELATGYCTLYGDMVGGFALIKDVLKTRAFELARWRNRQGRRPVIPPSTIDRPPSAELRENQRDSDSLPPYEVLDPILERYVEQDLRFDALVAEGFDPGTVQRVIRLVDAAEYKRRQGAPGVKITPRAFGRDRRMPITNRYRDEPFSEEADS